MRKMKNKFTFSWRQRESYNISHRVDFWEHSRMYIVIYCYFLYPIPPTLPHGSTILIRGWEGPRKVNDPDQTFGVGGLCAPEAGPGLCPPPPRVYRYTTGNPLYWARIAGKIKPEHRMDWTKARSMLGLTLHKRWVKVLLLLDLFSGDLIFRIGLWSLSKDKSFTERQIHQNGK